MKQSAEYFRNYFKNMTDEQKAKRKAYFSNYVKTHKDKVSEYNKRAYLKRKEKMTPEQKQKNRDYLRNYMANRLATDPEFKKKMNERNKLYQEKRRNARSFM